MKSPDNKGQIGPMSLEDLFPMLVAIIISFVFVAYLYTIIGQMLEQRSIEAMQRKALDLSEILVSRSPFVFDGKKCLFDREQLDSYNYSKINQDYGAKGYIIGVEIKDLQTETVWPYALESGGNAPVVGSPVAIRYSQDDVHEGLLKVRIRRTV
jgi:hypothetical protein